MTRWTSVLAAMALAVRCATTGPVDRRRLHVIEIGELTFEIRVALSLEDLLLWPLAVLRRDRIDEFHPRDDSAERRKTLAIQRTRVVLEADEQLGGPGIAPRGGKCQGATQVLLCDRIVGDRLVPLRVDRGVTVDPELDNKIGHHAEKTAAVIEAVLDQLAETGGPLGGPVGNDLDHHVATGHLERHPETVYVGFRPGGSAGFRRSGSHFRRLQRVSGTTGQQQAGQGQFPRLATHHRFHSPTTDRYDTLSCRPAGPTVQSTTRVPSTAVRSANSSESRLVIGPGADSSPAPISRPSTSTTAANSPIVPEQNISSAR